MTNEMLIALGRLTLKFAALDEHLAWAYEVLHTDSREHARNKMPMPFKNRTENVQTMVKSRAKNACMQSNDMITKLLEVLDNLKLIAEDRNMYVHGLIQDVPEADLCMVNHEARGKTRIEEITIDSITCLNRRIDCASAQLVRFVLDVYDLLRPAKTKG
jgi:hypothetical protein